MTSTTKTVLIVAGVGAGAFVLFELLRPKTQTVTPPRSATGASWISGLLQFGTTVAGAFTTNGPNRYGPGAQTQAPTWGTQGIDPSTGGVYLPPGDTYGPPSPGESSFESYAPGASAPGPWAPTGGGELS